MGTSMGPRFGMRTLLVAVAVVALLAALIAATGRAMRNRIAETSPIATWTSCSPSAS